MSSSVLAGVYAFYGDGAYDPWKVYETLEGGLGIENWGLKIENCQ